MKKNIVTMIVCVVVVAGAASVVCAQGPGSAPTKVSMNKEVTVKGTVHVTKDPKGEVTGASIKPVTGTSVKVALNSGEGKKLAESAGKMVEATGIEQAGSLEVKAFTVVPPMPTK